VKLLRLLCWFTPKARAERARRERHSLNGYSGEFRLGGKRHIL
jgi:hypothetical protein